MRRFVEQIWEEKGHIAWILSPLSLLYQIGWRTYLLMYQLGLKKAHIPGLKTICIGNCTAGGSGKTPFTLYLLEHLIADKRKVVLSTSGYGSEHYHGAALAPSGVLDPTLWSDEASMFRLIVPEVPIIVGHDRVQASKIGSETFPDHLLIMDDGFQHLRIQPDITMILEPNLENDFCFPAGPYREPRTLGHKRATRVLTYDDDIQPLPITVKTIDGAPLEPRTTVQVLCAIAHPQRLLNSLQTAGFYVKYSFLQPDHDPLQAGNLFDSISPDYPLIVTAKDYVKIKDHPEIERFQLAIADYRVGPRRPEEFFDWLYCRINELGKKSITR